MNPRHRRFAEEVLAGSSGAAAAQAAGYTARSAAVTAHRLLRRGDVRAAIEARQGVDAQRLDLTRQDAIRGLLEAVDLAREQHNPAAMIAAWKTLAAMLGFLAPQRHHVEVSAAVDAEMGRLGQLSDAELLKLMEAAG